MVYDTTDAVTVLHQTVDKDDIETKTELSREVFDFSSLGVTELEFGLHVTRTMSGSRCSIEKKHKPHLIIFFELVLIP